MTHKLVEAPENSNPMAMLAAHSVSNVHFTTSNFCLYNSIEASIAGALIVIQGDQWISDKSNLALRDRSNTANYSLIVDSV